MSTTKPIDYVILPISANEYEAAFELSTKLQEQGKSVDIDLTDRKLGNRFNRASKIADYAIVIGDSEVISRQYKAKNLQTGEVVDL